MADGSGAAQAAQGAGAGHVGAAQGAAADEAGAAVRRYWFILYVHDEPDALMRVLGPFTVRQVRLSGVTLDRQGEVVCIQIEVEAVAPALADRLARLLEGMPVVRGVGLGWRDWSGPAST
ncbi:hypothetical protein C5708_15875 [Caulobacter sp. CCUG 60055]|uniref:hypothetical protein n=1 Tax=Caulobacter sp. CCUG 60055 TaxID=2100090 RepID=UPI001FA70BDA|nr:hypothetical protein [Caulobacter sp. CCUG 60055]MBQ1542197.1 hypothetical protein [Caulobacteraceae bacterium]MCI3181725.1 hypothetical protein [Caulobacter sp. CCUG 60055]